MIDIKNTHDGFADIHATQEEWDGLKVIVAYAAQIYDDTDLFYDHMTIEAVADLNVELKTHHDVPAPLEKKYVKTLLGIVCGTDTLIIPNMPRGFHRHLVSRLEKFNMLDVFEERDLADKLKAIARQQD